MSQYMNDIERGWVVFGWDPPLQSFFLRVHDMHVDEDDNPVVWLGVTAATAMYEIDDLVSAAQKHGLEIGQTMRVVLQGDKDHGV